MNSCYIALKADFVLVFFLPNVLGVLFCRGERTDEPVHRKLRVAVIAVERHVMDVMEVITGAWKDVATMTKPCANSVVDEDSKENCGMASERNGDEARRVVDRCLNGVHACS